MEPASPTNRQEDHAAGRRAREVYRYFRPERPAPIYKNASLSSSGTSQLDLSAQPDRLPEVQIQNYDAPAPSQTSAPQESREPTWAPLGALPESMVLGNSSSTLNSFAQLAALRLNVDRVFISVSDRDSQFIIAQAAQATRDNNKYDGLSDGVYTGCSTLDVSSWTMCKDTVALQPSNRETGEYNFIVSHDLSEDDRYKDLPMVKDDPKFRFYAGTPLTTDKNINLGCFFVLDTKTHHDFTDLEKETMGHMGMLIMDFLKVSRQASEGRRAARLSHGLNCFVEGGWSFADESQNPVLGAIKQKARAESSENPASASSTHRDQLSVQGSRSRSSGASSYRSASTNHNDAEPPQDDKAYPENTGEDKVQSTTWTFQRAANLIRESLELEGSDGVVFVEAGNAPLRESSSDSDASSAADTSKSASVLAISTQDNPNDKTSKSPVSRSIQYLHEDFLRRLLNRYNRGNIWCFHRDGMLSSSDGEDSGSSSRKSRGRERPSTLRNKAQKKRKATENTVLNRCFPGATQILFVPLWNSANSQWFGGFFCWNTVESNVFNPSVELSSLLGFGSSIMSECNRVESLIADRQKADFLGSISHELRSPLHGILAAAEMMQDTELVSYQSSLMDTIDACGRTLLDTMNQVLDYSKIVSLERQLRHLKKQKTFSPNRKHLRSLATHLDRYTPTDISVLAEEVVEGMCLGHAHSHKTASPSLPTDGTRITDTTNDSSTPSPQVDVDIDIAPNDWVYYTPPGALRRIIMNVFSNAMKYTTKGRVSLRLEVKDSSEPRQAQKRDQVTLTVSDTGKGISEGFLRGRLFVPFAQEDTLASGSGLGLSIVRSLLKSLEGSINVQSKPGEGTTVKVTLPLSRPEADDSDGVCRPVLPSSLRGREVVPNESNHLLAAYPGRKAAILGLEPEDAFKDQSWACISRYLTEWYGFNLVSASFEAPIDILLAEEMPSEEDLSKFSTISALLLLSNKGMSYDTKSVYWPSIINVVNVVNRPCGPHKLARFIRKGLQQSRELIIGSVPTSLAKRPKNTLIKEVNPIPDQSQPPPDKNSSTTHINPTPKMEKSDDPKNKREPRILVVEDNKINLNLMLTFLKKRKVPAFNSAENGQLAVAAVKEEQQGYDIIFMDISMPVMDGFEATRNIRAIERERNGKTKPAIIIALTGLSSSHNELDALESGMDFFLTKPVAFKHVTKILNEWSETGLQGQSQKVWAQITS
ncbi:hypothetical protein N7532_002849 [Penicillium argentinense]|uniref:Uncharacterized protein n=1 Tax=Penicillium argentinense TaxID=1131581 RepID=A0A9W9KKK9_9EURO|nr:uncharacterized protein N7532_002849 [Penicillium argentinense]KAJ5110204.1 hypothetical protein N7532_002849 [Penicillium argentinense]